eukprot:g10567.t1
MFQVITGDSWSEAVARPLVHGQDGVLAFGSAMYFISFQLVCGVVLINVTIAILLEKMVDDGSEKLGLGIDLDKLPIEVLDGAISGSLTGDALGEAGEMLEMEGEMLVQSLGVSSKSLALVGATTARSCQLQPSILADLNLSVLLNLSLSSDDSVAWEGVALAVADAKPQLLMACSTEVGASRLVAALRSAGEEGFFPEALLLPSADLTTWDLSWAMLGTMRPLRRAGSMGDGRARHPVSKTTWRPPWLPSVASPSAAQVAPSWAAAETFAAAELLMLQLEGGGSFSGAAWGAKKKRLSGHLQESGAFEAELRAMEPDEAMKAVMEAEDDLEEVLGDEEDAEAGWEGGEGEEMCRPRDEEDEALQLDHLLDEGKFHVGVSWVHLAGLKGKREQYNGMKCLITSFGVRNPALVKVRGVEKNEDGKYIALWVKRIHCRNTVHKDTGAWKATPNPEREELFKLIDVNHNGMLSLAEIDKALPDVMGCVALFNAKPAIIRAFLAATERPPHRNDEAAFREHARAYVKPGEQFRRLIQYLHEFFEMYLIFQDMVDADEDRRIDCKEFANFIASGKAEKVGIKVTPEMMEDRCGSTLMPGYSLFNEIDEDQGGCILFKEFSDYCIRKGLRNPDRDPMESDTGKLRDMFHSAKDMDDAISIGRFVEILKKVGIKDGEIDAMIKATDKNHNYKIDVDEFIDWLMADGHHAALKRAERSGTESSGRANDGPPACKNGCGFKAAPGVTRSGKPLDTCCPQQTDLQKGERRNIAEGRCAWLHMLANTVLKAYAKAGDPIGALDWVQVMRDMNCSFNTRSTGKLLDAAALGERLDLAERFLAALLPAARGGPSLGLPVDQETHRTLALALCRASSTDAYRCLLWSQRWAAVEGSDARCQGAVVYAWELVGEGSSVTLQVERSQGEERDYNALADACAKRGDLEGVHGWIEKIQASGLALNEVSFNIVMDAYGQQGRLLQASRWKMLEHGIPPNVFSYGTMISACARKGYADEAEEWLLEMWRVALHPLEENLVTPSVISYATVIDSFAQTGDATGAVEWFERLSAQHPEAAKTAAHANNAVLAAFARKGDSGGATKWLQEMISRSCLPSVVSYNTLIKSYAKSSSPQEALECLEDMQSAQLEPNLISYNTVIAAYAHAGDPDHVAEVLERTVSLGTCGQGVRTVQVLWRRAGLGRPGRA